MYVLFVLSYSWYGLVALFTGVENMYITPVGYYMSVMYYRISKKNDLELDFIKFKFQLY